MNKKQIIYVMCVVIIVVAAYNTVMTAPHLHPSLAEAMVKNGYDLNGNSKIDKKEMQTIRTLALSGSDITDISGLTETDSPNLTSVYFSQISGLKDYDFSNNPQIIELMLDVCNIQSMSQITANENLQRLSLAGNQLTDISEIEKYSSLTKLAIDHNQINDISSIKKLPSLKTIDLRGNPITDYTVFQSTREITTVYLDKLQYQELQKQIPKLNSNIDFKVSD